MKRRNHVLKICLLFFCIAVHSYAHRPTGEQFAAMSYENAQTILKTSAPGEASIKYSAAALSSKRMDLITLCFSNQYFCGELYNEIKKMPESAVLREQVLIMMLKTRSPFWPSDNYALSSEPRVIEGDWGAPFLSLARKYLPGISISSDDLLAGTVARARLADQIERAAKSSFEKNAPPPSAETSSLEDQSATHSKAFLNVMASQQGETQQRYFLWFSGGALAAIVMAWVILKKRRPNAHPKNGESK